MGEPQTVSASGIGNVAADKLRLEPQATINSVRTFQKGNRGEQIQIIDRTSDGNQEIGISLQGMLFNHNGNVPREKTGAPVLKMVANALENANAEVIAFEGHTDSTGPDSFNQNFSETRAALVKERVSKLSKLRLGAAKVLGFGKKKLANQNEIINGKPNLVARAQNRRVEVIVRKEKDISEQLARAFDKAGWKETKFSNLTMVPAPNKAELASVLDVGPNRRPEDKVLEKFADAGAGRSEIVSPVEPIPPPPNMSAEIRPRVNNEEARLRLGETPDLPTTPIAIPPAPSAARSEPTAAQLEKAFAEAAKIILNGTSNVEGLKNFDVEAKGMPCVMTEILSRKDLTPNQREAAQDILRSFKGYLSYLGKLKTEEYGSPIHRRNVVEAMRAARKMDRVPLFDSRKCAAGFLDPETDSDARMKVMTPPHKGAGSGRYHSCVLGQLEGTAEPLVIKPTELQGSNSLDRDYNTIASSAKFGYNVQVAYYGSKDHEFAKVAIASFDVADNMFKYISFNTVSGIKLPNGDKQPLIAHVADIIRKHMTERGGHVAENGELSAVTTALKK